MNRKNTFAEKHPILNLLLALTLLGLIIYGLILFLDFVLSSTINGFNVLVHSLTNFDTVVIVTIITAGVSVFSVIVSSIISKYIDYKQTRRTYLSQKREIPYGEFVEMIYKIQSNIKNKDKYTQEEMLKDIASFSRQITLWGSPKVVSKWIEYREGAQKKDNAKNLLLLEDIMNEMRKDLGLKKAKKGQLLGFFINDIKDTIKKVAK